ncbi:MBL fold metallo-hydrolase [Neorhizobium sp. Rsf11]|uniref:quorum-quenching N-acyl-homoserine lactonase n=2 Tax=Neorhizobium TaxID=1525371 RepID=A0ABV0M371_9HYPH|nr:MBL fold metallo-hydrolase [Neorhizobium petrolearium]MCC2609426.1 MBL fold metallo-hydrolase [Neorhizobium petrolearium]WGI69637.1 MBL fold metallo-hydrolase [Neorhizobium petrolearium]
MPNPASYDILMPGFPGRSSRGFLGWSTILLLKTYEGHALFDTGGSGDRPGLMAALAERGIDRHDIRTVILSHLHFDHIANVECFPKAEIVLHESEFAYVRDHRFDDPAISRFQVESLLRSPQLTLVSGELEVLPGVRMISTPGHSGGHVSLVMTVDGKRVVLAQDAIKHRGEIETGAPAGAFDEEMARASIRRIVGMADIVVPGHDGPLTIENGRVAAAPSVCAEVSLTLDGRCFLLEV